MKHDFKQITPTDKFGWHIQLLPIYERLFEKLKWEMDSCGERCSKSGMLLEIGTDGGGGLLMYADYFWSYQIHGCDPFLRPRGIASNPSIHDHNRNAYDPATVSHFKSIGEWDIIIDDGPHSIESQLFFVEHYPQLLTEDGLAIVEDIQDPSHIERLGAKVPAGFFSFAVDMRHVEPKRYDNLIFCIQRSAP